MNFKESLPVVYTAQSKHWFHAKMLICQYALQQGVVPLNPFNLWAYFLDDLVERVGRKVTGHRGGTVLQNTEGAACVSRGHRRAGQEAGRLVGAIARDEGDGRAAAGKSSGP